MGYLSAIRPENGWGDITILLSLSHKSAEIQRLPYIISHNQGSNISPRGEKEETRIHFTLFSNKHFKRMRKNYNLTNNE